jgi:hypothetical protein
MGIAFLLALTLASLAFAQARPKVRPFTAFIRIDAEHHEAQAAKILKLTYTSGSKFADSPDVPKLVGNAMGRQ